MIRIDSMRTEPELMNLSPTTREKAILIAYDLLQTGEVSPKQAMNNAILIAKNWAVQNINRKVWKILKINEQEIL